MGDYSSGDMVIASVLVGMIVSLLTGAIVSGETINGWQLFTAAQACSDAGGVDYLEVIGNTVKGVCISGADFTIHPSLK